MRTALKIAGVVVLALALVVGVTLARVRARTPRVLVGPGDAAVVRGERFLAGPRS